MLRHTALGIPHVRSLKNAGKEKKNSTEIEAE